MSSDSEAASDAGFVQDVYEDSAVADDTPRLYQPENQVDNKLGPTEQAVGVPVAVQRILQLRRDEDRQKTEEGGQDFCQVPLIGAQGQLTTEDWTPQLREFSEEVQKLQNEAPRLLEVNTYFDLHAYNLEPWAAKQKDEPGSLLLMYMFYSRIFEKIIGKQKGVDVPLFAKVDFGDRLLGFRAILEWARDFRMCPARVPRKELERLYVTCHAGNQPSHEKFASKITYSEFVTLVALCGNTGEPMDRSKIDGSRVRESETRLEQAKRLANFLCLANSKKVKLDLHNAYRDVHFWKLSDGADFEKEARAAEMRSRPIYRVDTLDLGEDGVEVAAARKYLEQFTWCRGNHLWEEFEVPCLDMGSFVLEGATKRFKVSITNRGHSLAKISLHVSSAGPLRLPWHDTTLGPGQKTDVFAEVIPLECGEWKGDCLVRATWKGAYAPGQQDVRVPTYLRILQPSRGRELASRLPVHAPRPFRPGSAKRIFIDSAPLHNQQLRAHMPHKPARPYSAASSATACRLPRPSSCNAKRPSSSRADCSTGVPSSRALSAVGPASSRGCSSASGAPAMLGQAAHGHLLGRPRSAPLASVQPSSTPVSARVRPSSAAGGRPSSGQHGAMGPGQSRYPRPRSETRP